MSVRSAAIVAGFSGILYPDFCFFEILDPVSSKMVVVDGMAAGDVINVKRENFAGDGWEPYMENGVLIQLNVNNSSFAPMKPGVFSLDGAVEGAVTIYTEANAADGTAVGADNPIKPVAGYDIATTAQGQSVVIDVLANDTDQDGAIDGTTVVIVVQPEWGSVAINAATGAVTYTPADGFVGTDRFSYTVADNDGWISNPAVVDVAVLASVVVDPGEDVLLSENLLMFIEDVDGSMVDTIGGSELLWSTSGPVCDAEGGLTEDIPVHAGRDLWLGPSYTRGVGQLTPAGYPEIQEGTTSASMAGTSGGNGASIEMAGERPDGVELITNGDFDYDITGWRASGTPILAYEGGQLKSTAIKSGYGACQGFAVESGGVYLVKAESTTSSGHMIRVCSTPTPAAATIIAASDNYTSSTSFSLIVTATTDEMSVYLRHASSGEVFWDNISVQKLEPYENTELLECFTGSPMTAIVGVTMGVGSADIITPVNITTVNDSVSGFVFLDTGGTIKCSDGTNTATVTIAGGYSALDEIYAVPQVSADGTQMRIGYVKNDDTSVTWGSYVTYSGTFTPGDYFRFAFENTTVMWSKGLGQCDIALDDTNILKVAKELK